MVVPDEPLELMWVVRAAIVSGPSVAYGEPVELQHVQDTNLCHYTAEQVWTLDHAGSWRRDATLALGILC